MKSKLFLFGLISTAVLSIVGRAVIGEEPTTTSAPATQPAATTAAASPDTSTEESWPQSKTAWPVKDDTAIKPRVELYIPSVKKLEAEATRSHTATIVTKFAGLLGAMESFARTLPEELGDVPADARQKETVTEEVVSDEEDAGFEEIVELLTMIHNWPETSIVGAVYAPDVEGRPRFAVRFDYPIDDMKSRIAAVLSHEAAKKVLEGVQLTAQDGGGFAIELPESALVIAHVVPADGSQCWLKSHADLETPTSVWGRPANGDSDRETRLVYCRYNLTGTEKDTGSVFGDVPWVSSINYWCQVNAAGEWEEQFAAFWNGLVAMTAQQFISKVEKFYDVPAESYVAAVFGVPLGAMLDGMLGLPIGTLEISSKPETCICAVPGEGFFPVPDVVAQMQVRNADDILKNLAEAIKKINEDRAEEEQEPIWFEIDVDGRRVFWKQAEGGGMYAPFVMRPVLFLQDVTDKDGEIRQRLIVAMTSTSPKALVRRWVRGRLATERRTLPTDGELHWQAVVNWKQIYELAAPWLNLLASVTPEARFLPSVEEMGPALTDSRIDVQRKAAYLRTFHTGPVPVGAAFIPTVVGMAARSAQTSGSDLARERLAVRNLRVLYHHSKLFKQDYNRWPAEVLELEGYVDFAGNPQLLQLPKSSKTALSGFFEGVFGKPDDAKKAEDADEDEEEAEGRPDTSIYVIEWSETKWTLGYKSDTLDHLAALYIDQDGEIHRVPKGAKSGDESSEAADPTRVSAAVPAE